MSDAPQVLLDHRLKTLKLPTFLREYDKLAGNALRRASIACAISIVSPSSS